MLQMCGSNTGKTTDAVARAGGNTKPAGDGSAEAADDGSSDATGLGTAREAPISVYGFSADECRKAGCVNPYHYFTNYIDSPWLRAHPSHSFELEGILLQALSGIRQVCYVTNSSGTCVF